jgi:hypothetical protein
MKLQTEIWANTLTDHIRVHGAFAVARARALDVAEYEYYGCLQKSKCTSLFFPEISEIVIHQRSNRHISLRRATDEHNNPVHQKPHNDNDSAEHI